MQRSDQFFCRILTLVTNLTKGSKSWTFVSLRSTNDCKYKCIQKFFELHLKDSGYLN